MAPSPPLAAYVALSKRTDPITMIEIADAVIKAAIAYAEAHADSNTAEIVAGLTVALDTTALTMETIDALNASGIEPGAMRAGVLFSAAVRLLGFEGARRAFDEAALYEEAQAAHDRAQAARRRFEEERTP